MKALHLWRGALIDDEALYEKIPTLQAEVAGLLANKLDPRVLLNACQAMCDLLKAGGPKVDLLKNHLIEFGMASERDVQDSFAGLVEFLSEESLCTKLQRELGTKTPFNPQRTVHSDHIFECWSPVGFLVHAAPTNAFTVGVLSVVEGLLAGNINFLKTSASDSLFPQLFLNELIQCDVSGKLKDFIFVARVSSKQKDVLEKVFSLADAVAAWGGEESIEGLKALTPKGARFIDWGPKISFAYICQSKKNDREAMRRVAEDICVFDQQACSSPQVLYLETEDRKELDNYAKEFAQVLNEVSCATKALTPSLQEQAEITNVTELARLGSCLDENLLFEADDKSWRVLVEYKPGLRASPLYRSVWLKPLPRTKIIEVLHPLRSYLQTVGIAGNTIEIADIASIMSRAGLQRLNMVGHMHKSYMGEPHDGRYALQGYARKISFQFDEGFLGISDLDDVTTVPFQNPLPSTANVMTKEDFQASMVEDKYAQLFFKSGGSTGEPKLSIFTYADYHAQMAAAAEGLYAAGLDPTQDRCMNLFFGGGLYGGFVSFFSILEYIEATQFPMAAVEDIQFVCDMIVAKRVNVLLGMPSFLIQLFERCGQKLKAYGGVKKIFYGGEHFNSKQVEYLQREFGVELIRSATYGSVDAGPLGYQCRFSEGSVHHLHTKLQELEILKLNDNASVSDGETGRLIFSSKMRKGQKIARYEIGDLGRWVHGSCGCGRVAPRFELLGRHGDVCRVGTTFVNYRKICNLVADYYNYAGEVQMYLDNRNVKERIEVRLTSVSGYGPHEIRRLILDKYKDLGEVVKEGLVEMDIVFVRPADFARTPGSGKLRHIIDARKT